MRSRSLSAVTNWEFLGVWDVFGKDVICQIDHGLGLKKPGAAGERVARSK